MKKLHLVLKGKWFDMIDSGVKLEEYREIKGYWVKRLLCWIGRSCQFFGEDYSRTDRLQIPSGYYKAFDVVEFQHGYSKTARRMKFECLGIEIRTGNTDWGAEPGKEYFVIKLGKRL